MSGRGTRFKAETVGLGLVPRMSARRRSGAHGRVPRTGGDEIKAVEKWPGLWLRSVGLICEQVCCYSHVASDHIPFLAPKVPSSGPVNHESPHQRRIGCRWPT